MTTTVSGDVEVRRATAALQAGDLKAAERLLRAALAAKPEHVAALNILSIVLIRLGRFAEAESYLQRALQKYANSDATLSNYGLVLKALGRPVEALELFSKALKINPSVAETWNLRGTVFSELKRPSDAVGDFDRATRCDPSFAQAFYNKGITLIALGRHEDAIGSFDRAIALRPYAAEVDLLRAKLLADLGRRDAALDGIDRLLARAPNLAEAWLGRSNLLFELRRKDEALAACQRATALKPGLTEAWHACGNVLNELGHHREALAAYDQALTLNCDFAGAWHGRGNVLNELKRCDDALIAYDKALALRPDLAEAWLGRGNMLTELYRIDDALAAFDRALALRPDFAEAWLGRGNAFSALKRSSEALAAYDRSLALNADLAEAWFGRASVFVGLKQFEDALAAYDRALAVEPDLKFAKGDHLFAKRHLADWAGLDREILDVASGVTAGQAAIAPFAFLAISPSPADQLECAKRFIADQPTFPPIWRGEIRSSDRIRIAYLSADFREHASAYLTTGLFEHHDKSRFQTLAISFRPSKDSAARRRIEEAVDVFVDVYDRTDSDVADLVHRHQVDIAVDLMGFVGGNRLGVMARRAAPIQVNYLGYPGTMAADYIDYIIADPTIVPKEHFPFYGEQVVWLPDSYQANDSKRHVAERTPTRADCALPQSGFVFCCFNNTYKITPQIFDVWMRLLDKTAHSVFWLIEASPATRANLRREVERRGISPDRLIFAARLPHAEHLARYRHADLFLDTLPYNAHTTASDALWVGVPVLTCLGTTFAGRVAASLLKASDLDALVTNSLEEYEAVAIKLAEEPSYLASLRTRLQRNRLICPLFNTELFTRHIEAAYATMWECHQRGEPPRAFAVSRID